MRIESELRTLANRSGGSFKTLFDRDKHIGRFVAWMKSANIQTPSVAQLKGKHIEAYAAARAESVGKRTIQNELAAIRACLRQAGRDKLADQISNKVCGCAGASRDGTKQAITESRLEALRAGIIDPGMQVIIDLQRALGLREREAIMSPASLRTWQKQLAAGDPVRVIRGTKGGRARDVRPADQERALAAVQLALAVSGERGGHLLPKSDLKAALAFYSRQMHKAGFVGSEAGHSLRYAFAGDQLKAYQTQGFSRDEAAALTSCDLGHGDGRGRYIEQVYSRGTSTPF